MFAISTLSICIIFDQIVSAQDVSPVLTRGRGHFVMLSDGSVIGFASPVDWGGALYLNGFRNVTDIAVGGSQFVFKNEDNGDSDGHFQMAGQLSALTNSGALLVADADCSGGDDGTVDCKYSSARNVEIKSKAKQISGSNSLLAYVGEDGGLYVHQWLSVSQDEKAKSFQSLLSEEHKLVFSRIEINAHFLQVSVFDDMFAAIDDQSNIYLFGTKNELYEKFDTLSLINNASGLSYLIVPAATNIDQIYLGRVLYIKKSNGDLYYLGRLSYSEEHSFFSISPREYEDEYKNKNYGVLRLIATNVRTVFALASSTIIVFRDQRVDYTYRALGNFLFGDGEGRRISQDAFRAISNARTMYTSDKSQFYKSNSRNTLELLMDNVDINSADQNGDRIILVTKGGMYISGWTNLIGSALPEVHSECAKNTPLINTLKIDIPNCLKR